MHEQQLVPGGGGAQGLARIGDLGLEQGRQRRLGEAHGADHEVRRDLAPGTMLTVTVGERDTEKVVDETLLDHDLRRLPEPPSEAMLSALDSLPIGRAVLVQEELRRGREREEVLVQRSCQHPLVRAHERRGAPDQGDVSVAEPGEGHLLSHETLHVRARVGALGLAHGSRA
jgi:hypothetical protein